MGPRPKVAVPADRGPLWHFASNALSIVSSEALIRVSNFVIYAVIARNSGALAFGQLSLALSLFFAFQILATLGQRTLIVRDVARERGRAGGSAVGNQLPTALAVVSVGSALTLIPFGLMILAFGWDRQTTTVLLVVFLGLFPFALAQVLQGFLQGLERMRLIAYANVPLHTAKALVAGVLILNGAGVVAVAAVIAVTHWLVFLIELAFVSRHIRGARLWPDISSVRVAASRGWAFLGVDLVFAINSLIPVLVVSALLGQESVGVLGAANQAVVPLSLVINSLVLVAFPAMCRLFERKVEGTRLIVVTLIELILILVTPVVVTFSVFAQTVAELLFDREDFVPAGNLLRLIVWWSLVNVIVTVLGQTLWAIDRERTSLTIALWSASVGLVSNLVFVPLFGVNGVAASLVVVGVVMLVQHQRPLAASVSVIDIVESIWRPALAAALQVLVLVAMADMNTVQRALGGLFVYGVAVGALTWMAGRSERELRRGRVSFLSFLRDLGADTEPDMSQP